MNPGEYSKNIKIKLDNQSGQLCFFDPTHPLTRKNGMVTLGRHILSVRLGRWLEPGEYALFMDGNPQNVGPENLRLTTLAEMVSHVRNRQVELVCPYCGEVFHVSKSHKDRRVHCKAVCRQLHSRKFEVDRDELETYVWQMPTTEVARQFGVSDKAIEKRCKLLGVNKPPRGYWAKLAAEESKQRGCGSDPQDELE